MKVEEEESGCMWLTRSKVEEKRYSISRGFWTKV